MRRFIVILIICATWTQCSFAQNSTNGNNTKDAWEVWNDFKANPSNMYIFLDGLAASDSPQDFCQYVEEFVDICIRRGIEWNTLYEELEETVVPKSPDVTTYYAMTLCKHASKYAEIIKALDLLPKLNTFDNKTFKDVFINPDGTIAMIIKRNLDYGCYIKDLIEKSSGADIMTAYDNWYQTFVRQPSGKFELGVFKTKDKEEFFDPVASAASDIPELYIGFILDKQGKKIGEKYKQYDSFAKKSEELDKQDKKEAAQAQAKIKGTQDAIEKKMVAKYGRKAYNAMQMLQPYVGMPEGILREMVIVDKAGQSFMPYGFSHVASGYRIYLQTQTLAGLRAFGTVKAPKALYVRNGRVAAIKW